MKLTGKCKEDFEMWYSYHIYSETHHVFGILLFYKLPFSMQYGVYVDFFDSVGVTISNDSCEFTNEFEAVFYQFNTCVNGVNYGWKMSRHEARTKAIEKANEIYNEKMVS